MARITDPTFSNGTSGQRNFTPASWSTNNPSLGLDWRVRIHLPEGVSSFVNSPILKPLETSGSSMVFPTTPQIMISHSASYNSLQPVHTNYAFPIYMHSNTEDVVITGEFPVENEADGKYWIAAVHFLRSATKMFYGNSQTNLGAPPPLVHLSGYGDFVFNRVPGVLKLFSVDLSDGVDYIQVPIAPGTETNFSRDAIAGGFTYVPVLSRISVTFTPAYSRDQVRQFSLETFINGGYIGKGPDKGFI